MPGKRRALTLAVWRLVCRDENAHFTKNAGNALWNPVVLTPFSPGALRRLPCPTRPGVADVPAVIGAMAAIAPPHTAIQAK
jgi:hypothetical protein